MNLNEDEIQKLETKLVMLDYCCDVMALGYKYKDNATVAIDLEGVYEGYANVGEIDIIENILQPILNNGSISSNGKQIEVLSELNLEIPVEKYMEISQEVGYTMLINDIDYIKFKEYGLATKEFVSHVADLYTDVTQGYESSIEEAQVLFAKDGMYLVYPEDFIDPYEFLRVTIEVTKEIKDAVESYELKANSVEVA